MLSLSLSRVLPFIALATLASIGVRSAPAPADSIAIQAREIVPRASVPSAPRYVIYSDKYVSGAVPPVSEVEGFNVFALSFLTGSGAVDQAMSWQQLSASERSSAKAKYAAAGISLIVSAFGSTEAPTTSGLDPASAANTMAAWVKQYDLDGIDVDYEDFDAFNDGSSAAATWLETFTKTLRQQLPQGQYILTHAPVAPWFSSSQYPHGYLAIDKSVGNMIDWYNVQFYNQGASEYASCSSLLQSSGGSFPGTSVFELSKAGVSLDKIVIGKPATSSDASNGYMSPSTLAGCVAQATQDGWNAGVMVWEFPDAESSWINTVCG